MYPAHHELESDGSSIIMVVAAAAAAVVVVIVVVITLPCIHADGISCHTGHAAR